ncbi:Uncharacterised protein [Vibrio cholerae]|nr:Uncharacterised protein [Vibrio cholerae]CSI66065.1 Uncharacterised protein [Vibrio cholerae]
MRFRLMVSSSISLLADWAMIKPMRTLNRAALWLSFTRCLQREDVSNAFYLLPSVI